MVKTTKEWAQFQSEALEKIRKRRIREHEESDKDIDVFIEKHKGCSECKKMVLSHRELFRKNSKTFCIEIKLECRCGGRWNISWDSKEKKLCM